MNLNRQGTVVSLTGTNEDGKALLEGYEGKGKDKVMVADELIDRAIDMGFLSEGGQVSFSIDTPDEVLFQEYGTQLRTEVTEHIDGRITITIEIMDGKNAQPGAAQESVPKPDDPDTQGTGAAEPDDGRQAGSGDTDYGPEDGGEAGDDDDDSEGGGDTGYGPENDGVTDYVPGNTADTDYGPQNDGVTDYSYDGSSAGKDMNADGVDDDSDDDSNDDSDYDSGNDSDDDSDDDSGGGSDDDSDDDSDDGNDDADDSDD